MSARSGLRGRPLHWGRRRDRHGGRGTHRPPGGWWGWGRGNTGETGRFPRGSEQRERRSCTSLGEPAPTFPVVEDDDVLAGLEHDLEVAAVDGLLRPPAVDDSPLLADGDHVAAIHPARRP